VQIDELGIESRERMKQGFDVTAIVS